MDTTVDITWRIDRNGNTILSKRGEYIVNIAQMLFNIRPGTDEYDSHKGLFIKDKINKPFAENSRDTAYESEIVKQFTKYTDLVPVNVIAVYLKGKYRIYMQIRYMDQIYELEMSASRDSIDVVLRDNT